MSPQRFDELRANAMSDTSLLSPSDVIECLDEIARLAALVYVPGSFHCPKCKLQGSEGWNERAETPMPIDDDLRRDLARHVAALNRALVGLLKMVQTKEPHRSTDPAYITAIEAAKSFDAYVGKAEE